jgi:hypothetical protein
MPASRGFLIAMLAGAALSAQQPGPSTLVTTGRINNAPYTIRHLPVSSFPDLPKPAADALTRRGCLIPQTYEAYGPENVIHGSFERPGSTDWAVLCSSQGTVSLLVFLASAPVSNGLATPIPLASVPETSRLSPRPGRNDLGFDWGIDSAAPERVHDAQIGLNPRPQPLTHDAIADSTVEQRTVYRYFSSGSWTQLPLP